MLKRITITALMVALCAPTLWASKEEKLARKLDKELEKVSLTAAVIDGRRVVNRVMAEQLGVSRKQLVNERRKTGFVYGQIFAAHEVGRLADLEFEQVAEQMKQGHSLLDISEQRDVDLRKVLASAKKLNKKIDKELDRVASGDENEQAEDSSDDYDPSEDTLAADTADYTPAQLSLANQMVHERGLGSGQGMGGQMGGGRGAGGGVGGAMGSSMGGVRGHGPH
jgi:hypothetical protein